MEVHPAQNLESRNSDSATQLAGLHRDLATGDRRTKCQAIEGFRTLLSEDPSLLPELVPTLYQLFSDRFEVVRERAVTLMSDLSQDNKLATEFARIGEPDWYCFETRLADTNTREPAEEVRTQLLQLLASLLSRKSEQTRRVYADSVAVSLAAGLSDACPAARRVACETVATLGKDLPCLPYAATPLFRPLVAALKHPHVKLRAAAVTALGVAVCYSELKEVEEMYVPMAEMLFDPCLPARLALAETAARLLTDWHSRYSHFHRLLPIMLSSLSEEGAVGERAWTLWEAVGVKYLDENPDEDAAFLAPPERYPQGVLRPHQGCRALVATNVSRILAPLTGDLKDWKPEIRVKASQLLAALVLHAEQLATQHLSKIIALIIAHSNDPDEPSVSQQMLLSARYVAHFTSAALVADVVLPMLAPLELHAGHVGVVAALLETAPPNERGPYVGFLARPNTADCRDGDCQRAVLQCCQQLVEFPGAEETIFCALATVLGLAADNEIHNMACDSLAALAEASGLSQAELLARNCVPLVERLGQSVESWTRHATEWLTFAAVVRLPELSVSAVFPCVERVFRAVLARDGEAELRLQALLALTALLGSDRLDQHQVCLVVQDLLTPALSWSAGRTAEALRAAALAGLREALRGRALPASALPALAPLVAAALNEPGSARTVGLSCAGHIAKRLQEQPDPDVVDALYPGLARLLDAEEEVRLRAVATLAALLLPVPPALCAGVRSAALDRLLLHLDDPKPRVQKAVLDALLMLGRCFRAELRAKLSARAALMRNRAGVVALEDFLLAE